MSIRNWLIQTRVALDELWAAADRTFRGDERAGEHSDLTQLEDRVLLSAAPMPVDVAPEADTAQQEAPAVPSEGETAIAVAEGAVVDGVMQTTGQAEPTEFVEKRKNPEA